MSHSRILFGSAKQRAKLLGIAFELTQPLDIPEFCPILGIRLIRAIKRAKDNSASYDRINPNIGYTPENTWVISFRANYLKQNKVFRNMDELVAYCRAYGERGGTLVAGREAITVPDSAA
jgi:hypothetical protein